MPRVGPSFWRAVSIDTAGVPHGGPHGNVSRFAKEAGARGLYLCWSRPQRCFGLYSKRAGKYHWQMALKRPDNGAPIALTSEALWLVLHLWRNMAGSKASTLIQAVADAQRKARHKIAERQYREMDSVAKEIGRDACRDTGLLPRPIYSIPKRK
jgi:hypothetical protein